MNASARVALKGDIQLRRGIDIDLGLSLMAGLDANIRQFLAADLQAQVNAEAGIRGQIQLPLNLFDEAGLAVRLQAVAELAAGLRVGLGLSFAEFLDLAAADPNMGDTPIRLLRLFLEQVVLEASLYAKASVSAEAYANFVAVGSLIDNPATGAKAGFTIAAGAGAGLKAGAGYQFSVDIGFKNVSAFVGQTVDLLVDDVAGRIVAALPPGAAALAPTIRAARMPFRLALRMAFELGEHLALQAPAHSGAGQDGAGQCVLQVVLEELQRATLEGVLDAVTAKVTAVLDAASQAAAAEWAACSAERHALAAHLRSAPDPLFTLEATAFWGKAAELTVNLAAKLASRRAELVEPATALWCATQLLAAALGRIGDADRRKRIRAPRTEAPAFTGPLPSAPPQAAEALLRSRLQQLGSPAGHPLRYDDLVIYLGDEAIGLLQAQNAPVLGLLGKIVGPFAPTPAALVRLVLGNVASFPLAPGRAADPAAALQALLGGVSAFVRDNLNTALRQQLGPVLENEPDLRLLFDEVLMPSVDFALTVAAQEAMTWATSTVDSKQLTEALSAVLLRVLGRSLVVTGDILLSQAQANMADLLRKAAAAANAPKGLVETLHALPGIGVAAADLAEVVTDALEIGADVFGPMPDDKRQHIRGLLYQAIDPLGGKPAAQVLQALADPGLPDVAVMEALASELGSYAADRFLVFVERLVGRLLDHLTDAVRAVLDEVARTVTGWVTEVQSGIDQAVARLQQIAGEIVAAVAEVEQQMNAALASLGDLVESFNHPTARSRFISQVVDQAYAAAGGLLEDNVIYRTLVPASMKAGIRNTVKSLLREAIAASPLDQVLAAIGALAQQFDDLVDDARQLPRGAGFAAKVRELVLSRAVAAVDQALGAVRVDVRFSIDVPFVGSRVVDLGKVRVPAQAITGSVRPMIDGLGVFDEAIDGLATTLAALLAAEERRRNTELEQENVKAQHQRLTDLLDVTTGDDCGVTIARPVNLQAVDPGASVSIELVGFKPSILATGDDVPQRVHVIVNGREIDVGSLHASAAPATRAPGPGTVPRLPAVARSLPAPVARATGHNPLLGTAIRRGGATTSDAGGVTLTGTLPAEVITAGLNSLHVEVIVGDSRRYHASAGFYVNAAPPAGAPVPGTTRPRPIGAPPLPHARPPVAKDFGIFVPTARAVLVGQLRPKLTRPLAQHPLGPLAAVSPKIAGAVGLRPLPGPTLRPALRPR